MLDRIKRALPLLVTALLLAFTGAAVRPPPGGYATPVPSSSAPVHRLGAYKGTTAQFTINGAAASPPGFDATNSQTLTLQLATNPAPDVYQTQFFIYDPGNPSSPLASFNAPVLTFTPSTGIPATPTGTVTVQMPASGSHSYKIRCVVNGGVQASTGLVIPTWTYERIASIRGPNGVRKQIPGESTEYASRGWSDEQNRQVDSIDGLAPSAVKLNARMASTGTNVALTGLQTIDGVVGTGGDRVLVHDETDATTNGIWVMASGAWTRGSDADASSKFSPGMLIAVSEGTLYKNSRWYLTTAAPITLGATSLAFQPVTKTVDPKRFGAICNGTNDDTSALQAAINTGSDVGLGSGVTCKITAPLNFTTARQRFFGEGRQSIIRAATNTFHMLLPKADELVYENFALEGAATDETGGVAGAGQTGIFSSPANSASKVRVSRVWFSGPNGTTGVNAGIKIDAQNDWDVYDNTFDRTIGNNGGTGCGYGVLMAVASRNHIHGNRFIGDKTTTPVQGRHAVYLSVSGDENVIEGNVVKNYTSSNFPTNAGPSNAGGTNNVWRNNSMFSRSADAADSGGIEITGKWVGSVIQGNVSYDDGGNAIIIDDLATGGMVSPIITDNKIFRPGTAGIRIKGAVRPLVANNYVEDASQSSHGTNGAIVLQAYDASHSVSQGQVLNNVATSARLGTVITSATGNGVLIVATKVAHGLVTGDFVSIRKALGNTAMNGDWTITRVDANTFSLDGSTGNGTYTASSAVMDAPTHRCGVSLNGSVAALSDIVARGNRSVKGPTGDNEQVGTVTFGSSPSTTLGENYLIGTSIGDTVQTGARTVWLGPSGTVASSGFLRGPSSWLGVVARNNANSGDLQLLRTSIDDLLVGDAAVTGVYYNTATGGLHRFQVNGASILSITSTEIDVNTLLVLMNNAVIDQTVSSPLWRQVARSSDAATSNWTIRSQAPFASATGSNRNSGGFIFDVPTPVTGGTTGGFTVQTSGNAIEKVVEEGIDIGRGTAAPSGNPAANHFFFYVDPADGKLKAKGSSGTVTILAVP